MTGRVAGPATTGGDSDRRYYAEITRWLGMKPDEHEYKVMGLAPYAPARMTESAAELLGSLARVEGLDWRTSCNSNRFYGVLQRLLRGQRFDAVSGGVQLLLEQLVTEWVREAIARTGISDLVLSSGVFMMEIVYDDGSLAAYVERATQTSPEHPVLIDRFLDDAIEIDVDALYDGEDLTSAA